MKAKIGVIGSSISESVDVARKAKIIGREIAKANCVLLTGSSRGLPYEAVRGAKEKGGFAVGISPAANLSEHMQKYEFPREFFDLLIFTGFGYKGRNVILVRSCDAVLAVSGRIGTLNELTIAYDESKIIGILSGSGGISDEIERVLMIGDKKGGTTIYEQDPRTLVKRVYEACRSMTDAAARKVAQK